MRQFVDVILPLPLARCFTYLLPDHLVGQVQVGCRVVVPFGRKKFYTAIVSNIHYAAPEGYEAKEVSELLDGHPVLLPLQFRFWQWMSDYYLCTEGDVYKAALPSGLKLESETRVARNPDYEGEPPLTERERRIWEMLDGEKEQPLSDLEKEAGMASLLPVVRSMLEKEALLVREELKRAYKPKTEARIRLQADCHDEAALHRLFDELGRAPKQLALLMKYIELSGWMEKKGLREVSKKMLLEKTGAGVSALNALTEKGVFELYRQDVGRLRVEDASSVSLCPLSPAQQQAYETIQEGFRTKQVCLLHGVTSSGKTEVYMHLIAEALQAGKQVLYLLPEIALTAQLTERLGRVFGGRMVVYHSKFPDAERVEIWQKQVGDQAADLVLGVRSSVFLPFHRLGLVIVDEEHEASYKQQDPAPRYHARDAAVMLAVMHGARVLLGSATPSLESFSNALSGKYALAKLTERFGAVQLPEICTVDVRTLARRKQMVGTFSPFLLEKMRNALESHEQVILFQNRRGFAPMLECHTCGWVPRCKNCDVSLTYHRGINQLTCHYCGATYPVPRECPACGGTEIRDRGFGTEKVEEEIRRLFPEARVARMDLDTTRSRTAYERLIDDFQHRRTDILIGTQMVSKGLDFERVSVVGILNADSLLNYPDFRACERAYQLMVQVAGRAGRRDTRGLVVLQTRSEDHPVVRQVVDGDYEQMYAGQMAERAVFHYPPYHRLVYVYLKHRRADTVALAADAMAGRLRQAFGTRILGPDNPPVARIQNLYIKKIVVKIEHTASMAKVREQLRLAWRDVVADERFRSLCVYYDVDPM
ncbi:MAG: primosomal protein N' [Bacteroidaceae bacterium]